jgi:hypothetical protein
MNNRDNPNNPSDPNALQGAQEPLAAHPRGIPNAETTPAADQSWCPGCSAPLLGRSCKLRCLRCGYFEDCSNLI